MTSKWMTHRTVQALSALLLSAATFSSAYADKNPMTFEAPEELEIGAATTEVLVPHGAFWTNGAGLTQDALLLIDEIAQIERHGLDPDRYHLQALTTLVDLPWRPELREPLDGLFASAFEQLVTDLGQGLVAPKQAQRSWFQDAPTVNAKNAYLSLRLPGNTVKSVIEQYKQPNPDYKPLSEALLRYQKFQARGGWPFTLPGPAIKLGEKDPRVVTIAQRLQITGDLHRTVAIQSVTENSIYQEDLMLAVQRFQLRHGLAPDGVIGRNTINALNVPVAQKIETIKINLERMRWLPHDLGERHVITNIADYRLKVFNDGKEVLQMPIVAGKAKYKTPVFSDEIEYLVVNPNWTVPKSIMYRELLPKERKKPGFLARANFELITEENGTVITKDPNSLTPEELLDNHFRYTIRQKPGKKNALGKVKFMFPNKYSVYLHDTPAKSLFKRNKRAFSHGCVRLGSPKSLTDTLLGYEGWTKERVDKVFSKNKRRVIRLKKPIPNHIVYLTSWEDETHGVQFRNDVYGHDVDLSKALENPGKITWPATIISTLEKNVEVDLEM